MSLTLGGRLKTNFLPPIFLKRRRIEDRLATGFIHLFGGASLDTWRYRLLQREVGANPEIERLFPAERLREHWGYAPMEIRAADPNLYIHQLRYYRMLTYFQRAYPELFAAQTRVLNVGDTSGLLFRAMGRTGLALNMRPERVAYMQAKGIEAVVGNAEALQFTDRSFDYVFCFQTLEHVRSPLQVLQEMGRVARRAVFVSIPYVEQTRIWKRERFIREYRQATEAEIPHIEDDECHVFELSSSDLCNLLSYTELTCRENFRLDYFTSGMAQTAVERLVVRLTPSHFNFFVLEKG